MKAAKTTRSPVFKPKGTVYTTVRFEDQGQDFLEWDIEESTGEVFQVRPFQSWVWCGVQVDLRQLAVGQLVRFSRDGMAAKSVRYHIESIVGGRIK